MDAEPFPLPTMAGQVDQSPQRKVAPKIIAIDFDDTYTADPDLWRNFMAYAKRQGHKVICVTARSRTPENMEDLACMRAMKIPVYYTGGSAKLWYMQQLGVSVSLWIDDNPRSIVNGI